jgi:hypothetical protein
MKPLLTNVTFEEMQTFLTDPLSRIVDSRMLETGNDFGFILQLLHTDNTISQVEVKAKFTANPDGTLTYEGNYQKDALELFRLQYRNSPRMNPALYGLLDAADAESRVENTLPIQTQ